MNLKHNTKLFFWCLIISLFLWTFIKFSRNITIEKKILIEWENIPKQYYLNHDAPKSIEVDVEGEGFDLLTGILWYSPTAIIDLKKYTWKKNPLIICDDYFHQQLNQVFEKKNKKIFFSEPCLTLDFHKNSSRKTPIILVTKDITPNGYILDSAIIEPTHVYIYGKELDLKKIDTLYTKPIRKIETPKEIEEGTIDIFMPKIYNKMAKISENNVAYKLYYSQYTEIDIKVFLAVENLPSDFDVRFFPDSLDWKIKVKIQDVKKAMKRKWIKHIDFEKLKNIHQNNILVRDFEKTPYILDIEQKVKKVNYLIVEK